MRRLHPERTKKQNEQYKAKNPEKVRALNKQYYQSHKEQSAINAKKWADVNRESIRSKNAKWRKDNPEKMQTMRDAWLQKNRDKKKQSEARWRNENKKHIMEKGARRYVKNKEKMTVVSKKWRDANPEKTKQICVRRRARIRGATIGDTKAIASWEKKWRSLPEVQCSYCKNMFHPKKCDTDHFMPLTLGGPHSLENLVIACATCNRRKHNKHPDEWMALLATAPDCA